MVFPFAGLFAAGLGSALWSNVPGCPRFWAGGGCRLSMAGSFERVVHAFGQGNAVWPMVGSLEGLRGSSITGNVGRNAFFPNKGHPPRQGRCFRRNVSFYAISSRASCKRLHRAKPPWEGAFCTLPPAVCLRKMPERQDCTRENRTRRPRQERTARANPRAAPSPRRGIL